MPLSTRVALLTSPGRGALATVGVAGPEAVSIASSCFTPAGNPALGRLPLGRVVYGHWRHHAATAEEEVIIARSRDEQVDITCHGGEAAASSIIASLVSAGATECSVDDWIVDRANDAITAEALLLLARAETERTSAILLDQYRGTLRQTLEAAARSLREGGLQHARQALGALRETASLGLRLGSRWTVVVAGLPNAGKSSIVNAMVGYDRSIVFEEPGTTRDRVTVESAFDGWPVELVDTAGLRSATDPIEAAGVSRTCDEVARADLLLWVHDLSTGCHATLPEPRAEPILVANKSDLVVAGELPAEDWILTSARTGEGVDRLKSALVARLIPTAPAAGTPVIFTRRQLTGVELAIEGLDSGDPVQAIEQITELLDGDSP